MSLEEDYVLRILIAVGVFVTVERGDDSRNKDASAPELSRRVFISASFG